MLQVFLVHPDRMPKREVVFFSERKSLRNWTLHAAVMEVR